MPALRAEAVVAVAVMAVSGAALAQPRPWASKVPADLVRKANPLPSSPEVIAKGKEVFTNTCQPCHGEGAQGDGPAAEFMEPKPKPLVTAGKVSVPDGVAFWVITNGIDGTGMASLGDTLNEQERWQVIRYLHVLANPAAAAGTPAAVVSPVATVAPAPTPAATAAPVATPAKDKKVPKGTKPAGAK